MLTVLGGLAEFERDLIRARTGEGRARAKARGVKLGRPPKLTPHQKREAIERRDARRRNACRDRPQLQRQRRRSSFLRPTMPRLIRHCTPIRRCGGNATNLTLATDRKLAFINPIPRAFSVSATGWVAPDLPKKLAVGERGNVCALAEAPKAWIENVLD